VGKDLVRDVVYQPRNPDTAELGAAIVKTYHVPGFEQVAAACPVPIVIAGGKKLPEREALQMARDAINQGASGVDMGRNIFQSDSPVAMIGAVRKVVHDNSSVTEAYEYYMDMKNK
jgi:putative autoinducer-2 (AI-2) aldolase